MESLTEEQASEKCKALAHIFHLCGERLEAGKSPIDIILTLGNLLGLAEASMRNLDKDLSEDCKELSKKFYLLAVKPKP